MVAYMEEALKNKFEEFKGQEKTSKLFTICSISKDFSREQLGVFNQGFNVYFKPFNHRLFKEGSDPWKGVESKVTIKVVSEQPPIEVQCFIMSTKGQFATQSHQEGTSDPTRMNLNETLRTMQQSIEGLARKFIVLLQMLKSLRGARVVLQ
ncbi:hypothetical protein M9H77_29420 [Catharanthus roseus]|uniref:Uncharacterized protein n=1 Tax=Catharanthus roseus TaxID=4058 RepID=A0ACB9ZWK0_CATRO|nr:hypothetical protein M9H77_29420 [Catharanthus roseus]